MSIIGNSFPHSFCVSNCLIHWSSHECCPQTHCSNLSPQSIFCWFWAFCFKHRHRVGAAWKDWRVTRSGGHCSLLEPGRAITQCWGRAGYGAQTLLCPSLKMTIALSSWAENLWTTGILPERAGTGPQPSWYQPEHVLSQLWDTQTLNPDLMWLNKSWTKVPYIILFLLTKLRYCFAMKSSCRNARSEPISSWRTERSWVNLLKEQKIRSSAGANWQKTIDLQSYVGLHQLKILPIPVLLHSLEIVLNYYILFYFYFLNENAYLNGRINICRISEWINKHMTKQCRGMETTLSNGRVISKDDYLWLIDSACKSGRWLCCDSRGREGRRRERSRWRECFWVCSLLKKRKVGQLGTRTLITITPSDKSICYAVKFDAHTANWTPCKGRCSYLVGLSELTTSFCFKHASYACRKCC